MSFRPIGNNVLIRPDPWEGETDSGLFVPRPAREQGHTRTAVVVAVGPGKMVTEVCHNGPAVGERVPPEPRPGDRVVYQNFIGQDRYAQPDKYGERLLILSADDILAVIEPEGAKPFPAEVLKSKPAPRYG